MKKLITTGLIGLALSTCFAVYAHTEMQQRARLEAVQSGDAALWCDLRQGRVQVPAERVTGLVDGRWFFVEGSARQCEVVEL